MVLALTVIVAPTVWPGRMAEDVGVTVTVNGGVTFVMYSFVHVAAAATTANTNRERSRASVRGSKQARASTDRRSRGRPVRVVL